MTQSKYFRIAMLEQSKSSRLRAGSSKSESLRCRVAADLLPPYPTRGKRLLSLLYWWWVLYFCLTTHTSISDCGGGWRLGRSGSWRECRCSSGMHIDRSGAAAWGFGPFVFSGYHCYNLRASPESLPAVSVVFLGPSKWSFYRSPSWIGLLWFRLCRSPCTRGKTNSWRSKMAVLERFSRRLSFFHRMSPSHRVYIQGAVLWFHEIGIWQRHTIHLFHSRDTRSEFDRSILFFGWSHKLTCSACLVHFQADPWC